MALLDKENLAAMKAKREKFRLNHVGTKLNDAELKEFTALVEKRKQTSSELIRELIFREIQRDKEGLQPSPELIELIALRLVVVNLLQPLLLFNHLMPEERLNQLFDEVKPVKKKLARERLRELLEKP